MCGFHENDVGVSDLTETNVTDVTYQGKAFMTDGMKKQRQFGGVTKHRGVKAKNDLRFVLDSGCTNTIVANKAHIENYRLSSFRMQTANNGSMHCPGAGKLITDSITLETVKHCPELALNLMSISELCDLGNTVEFTATGCNVWNKDKKIVLRGIREGGLYIYEPDIASALAVADTTEKSQLAHRRMGHLNYRSLKLLKHLSTGLELDSVPSQVCEPCALAKSARTPFPKSNHIASRKGELIHSDECTINVACVNGGYKYFITFIDDFTRYLSL